MRRTIDPAGIAPPAAGYHHALLVERPARTLYLSGQLGEHPDGSIAADVDGQARQAWANVEAILREAEMAVGDIVKVVSYLVGEQHIKRYCAVHDAVAGAHRPPWTLVVVAALGAPRYLVEIDVVAAR